MGEVYLENLDEPSPEGIMEGKNLLDRYQMFEELGRGGRGVVYRARDQILDREVAIKIILPKTLTPESRRHFRHEARTTASLEHPAITPVYDFGQHDDELFIVMPLLRGQTLRILIENGPLNPRKAIEILIQVADALDYSHRRGVIHRDVKPENIMVGWHRHRMPQVKVLDFGLATHMEDAQLAETKTIEGTPLYISPEQLLGDEIDPGSDIYALGMVLYECLAGEHPLKHGEGTVFQRVLFEEPGSLRARGVAISENLDHLILSSLAKEKSDRPRSAREVLRSLIDARRALEAKPSASPAPKAGPVRDAEVCEEPRSDGSGSETAVHRPGTEQPLPAEELSFVDRLGDLLLVQGEYLEAQEAYRQARETQRAAAGLLSPWVETRYLLKLAQLASKLGRYREALDRCRQGLEIIGSSSCLRAAELMALGGLVCCMCGRYREAEVWLTRGRRRLGHSACGDAETLQVEVMLTRTEGNLFMGLEQPSRAVEIYRRALAMSEELDDRWEHSIGLFNVGEALLEAGDEEAAIVYLRRAIDEKSAIGDRWGLAYVRHALARLYLRQAALDSARDEAAGGLRLADEIGDPKIASRLRTLLGRVHLEQDDSEGAAEHFEAALQEAERIASEPDVAQARQGLVASRSRLA